MKSKRLFMFLSIVVLVLLFASCAGNSVNEPVEMPDNSSDDGLPPVAAVKARELLASILGVDISQVEIVSQEQAIWSDSCLGLGGPAESCLAAEFPGWLVELSVKGEAYFARTDELGEIIRFEGMDPADYAGPIPVEPSDGGENGDQGSSDGTAPEAAEKARLALAEKLGIATNEIDVVSFSKTEWPNGCLGLAGEDEMCTEALVSGWRVELSADGQMFIARTDEFGDAVRFE
jgi:hypothetical protein